MLILLLWSPAFSQGTRGEIEGRITDPTGASIPNATVTVTDTLRGTKTTVKTNTAGAYTVTQLLPSTYSVSAAATGFRTAVHSALDLTVGATLAINFQLQPGVVTQTVTVTGGTPLLQVTNATVGGTLSNTIINNLPLNGRNFLNLMQLRPGVAIYPGGGFQAQSTNGLPGTYVGYELDGLQHTEPFQGQPTFNESNFAGDAATILPIDALQTFRIMQNSPAQYGGYAGSIVELALKSGTNHFHGDAYAFGRTSSLDARNYFNPVGTPALGHNVEQFGATVGGPIIRNKLFFFTGFEGQRYTIGNAWTSSIPVSVSLAAQNPVSPNCGYIPAGNCAISIPNAEADLKAGGYSLSPVSLALLKQYPNNPGPSNLVPGGFPNTNTSDNGVVHVNYKLNNTNQLSYDMFLGDQTGNYVTAPPIIQPYFSSITDMLVESMGFHWISNPSSNWVNTLGFGYDRFRQGPIVPADENKSPSSYGIQTGVSGLLSGGLPDIYVKPFTVMGGDNVLPKVLGPDFIYDLNDSVSWIHGNQNIIFGAEVTHWIVRAARLANSRGKIKFFAAGTYGASQSPFHNKSTSLEDFLAGNPGLGIIQSGYALRRVNQWYFAPFIQDNWRATPTLTVNMGLRYNYTTPMHDSKGLLGNFVPSVGLIQQGVNGVGDVYNADPNDISPRIGFAWNPHSGKTVVRGGFSMMYQRIDLFALLSQLSATNGLTTGLAAVPTGASCEPLAPTCGKNGTINVAFAVGLPINWNSPPGGSTTVFPPPPVNCISLGGCSIMSVPQGFQNPAVLGWNLGVQHQFTNNLALDVTYVGNHVRNFLQLVDINQPTPGSFAGINALAGPGMPYYSKYPFLSFINQLGNTGTSNYDGLQVTLTQHTWHGLSYLAAYTWSHALDTSTGDPGAQPQNSLRPGAEYASSGFDIRQRFTFSGTYALPGVKGFGQALRGWQINSIVTLQGGQPWSIQDAGNNISLTSEFNDRWNLYGSSSNFKILSKPFIYCTSSTNCQTFTSAGTLPPAQAAADWAQCMGHASSEPNGPGGSTGLQSLASFGCYASTNGKSFIVPPSLGTFGSTGRNVFRGPGFYDWDASIFKDFNIKERLTAEFRFEVFNVLNHPTFNNPDTISGFLTNDPSAPGTFGCGCVTADVAADNPVFGSGGPRGIQLGLKLLF